MGETEPSPILGRPLELRQILSCDMIIVRRNQIGIKRITVNTTFLIVGERKLDFFI